MKVKVYASPTQKENELEEVDLTLTTRRGAECLIGRDPDSDLVLDSNDVSRLHGKFFAQAGNYYFCDVGSRNGSIVNGKLAEKDHSYMLKDGDIIRIGDFVLMLEDEMPNSQQDETVYRIIQPSPFSSNWRQQNPSAAPQEAQLTNDDAVAPIPVAEEISPEQEDSEKEEIVNTSEELEQNFEPTFIQADEVATPEHPTDTHETTETNELEDNEDNIVISTHETENVAEEPWEAPEPTHEYTVVQVNDVDDEITSNVHETENIPEESLETPENIVEDTDVQARDVDDEITSNIHETENVAEEPWVAPEHTHEYTIVQVNDVDDEITSNIDETENISEESLETPEDIIEDTDVQARDIKEDAEPVHDEEESEIIEAISNDSENSENVNFDTPSQQAEEELVSEASILPSEVHNEEPIATSEEIAHEAEELEEPSIQIAKILEEKQIVIIGHDSKKSELIELVSEYEEFLSCCLTRTWQTFSDYLYKQTGLSVTQEIPPANSGGYQAINSLVNSGEIIAVIFLRDLMMAPQPGQASEEALVRICNINNVLLATNLPTAKAIVYYLKNLKD